jgi:hypothetical protein
MDEDKENVPNVVASGGDTVQDYAPIIEVEEQEHANEIASSDEEDGISSVPVPAETTASPSSNLSKSSQLGNQSPRSNVSTRSKR